MKRASFLRLALSLLFLLCLPSCSHSFRQAWKKTPVVSGVAGKWQGTWFSEATGHHGNLRCLVLPAVDSRGDHEFFYHATWMTFLSGSYRALHTVKQQRDGNFTFKGEHQMPSWAGGLYHYEGTIKDDDFRASYRSSMDHGTYTMKRVP